MLRPTHICVFLVAILTVSLFGTGCSATRTSKTLKIPTESFKSSVELANKNISSSKLTLKDGETIKVDELKVVNGSLKGITNDGEDISVPILSIDKVELPQGITYNFETRKKNISVGSNFPSKKLEYEVNQIGGEKDDARINLRNGISVNIKDISLDQKSIVGKTESGEPFRVNISKVEKIYLAKSGILYNVSIPNERVVGPSGRPYRYEVNSLSEVGSTSVALRNGEKMKLKKIKVNTDSTFGITYNKESFRLPTSSVKSIKISGNGWETAYRFKTPSTQTGISKTDSISRRQRKDSKVLRKQPPREEGQKSAVDTQIPKTSMNRPDDIAVVIGNKTYKNGDIPDVDYAVRDAQIMKKYLTHTLGFQEENIIYVENASGSDMGRVFGTDDDPQGQLYNWVKTGASSVFVYYSGHGAPNPETGNAYLIASNTNPNYLSQNGYPLGQLYENLAKVNAQSVTVVLESCFSGTAEGGAVIQNASPAVLSVENPMVSMDQGMAFTAGAGDQIASWYPKKKHGLFTYYFLMSLRGHADVNGDSAVTGKEMKSYLTDKVPYRARRMFNREQTPQVMGQNLDRVLVRYVNSAPTAQQKARLPATTTNMEKSLKETLSLPSGAKKVTSIDGAEALQEGDVIVGVSGSDLTEKGQLAKVVGQHKPGDTLQFTILRDGRSRAVSITLTGQ